MENKQEPVWSLVQAKHWEGQGEQQGPAVESSTQRPAGAKQRSNW